MHRFLIAGCTHAPITHQGYWKWLLEQIEEFKPDTFVHLGDAFEGKCAKRWPKHSDEDWTMEQEHLAFASQVSQINELVQGQKVWLYGNHDDNVFTLHPDRIAADIIDSLHWRANIHVSDALKGWTVIEEYGHRPRFRLGPITCQHGCALGDKAEQDAAYQYGTPFGLYVSAHTHRPTPVTRARERKVRLPYWFANVGTGADWSRMHYMDRMSMGLWGRGCLVGEVSESAIKNHRTAFASKQWDAELRIHSWAADE